MLLTHRSRPKLLMIRLLRCYLMHRSIPKLLMIRWLLILRWPHWLRSRQMHLSFLTRLTLLMLLMLPKLLNCQSFRSRQSCLTHPKLHSLRRHQMLRWPHWLR